MQLVGCGLTKVLLNITLPAKAVVVSEGSSTLNLEVRVRLEEGIVVLGHLAAER